MICPSSNFWLLVLLMITALSAVGDTGSSQSRYVIGSPDFDGIGKQYMGRSISHVMGHRGAGWLERRSREAEERTDLLVGSLPLHKTSVVADIGAGTGYFTFPVARLVPDGTVFAVDIQQEMLDLVAQRRAHLAADNVALVLGAIDDVNLPAASIDLAFIVDAYHEFSHPFEMGRSIFEALKPGGQLVLIEYRSEDKTVPIKRLHKMTQGQAEKEMAVLGFRLTDAPDFLPQQHFLVFTKPAEDLAPPVTGQ